MRSKRKIRGFIISAIVLAGLFVISKVVHLGPRLRLGSQTTSILEGATRVQTFRVMSSIEAKERKHEHKPSLVNPASPQIDGCYLMATAKEQGPALAHRISNILLDEATYTDAKLACITLPGIVFRVWKGSQSLDIVLCFHCSEISTVTRDANGKSMGGIYTVMAGNSRSDFAHLAKAAFPQDPEIQAL